MPESNYHHSFPVIRATVGGSLGGFVGISIVIFGVLGCCRLARSASRMTTTTQPVVPVTTVFMTSSQQADEMSTHQPKTPPPTNEMSTEPSQALPPSYETCTHPSQAPPPSYEMSAYKPQTASCLRNLKDSP